MFHQQHVRHACRASRCPRFAKAQGVCLMHLRQEIKRDRIKASQTEKYFYHSMPTQASVAAKSEQKIKPSLSCKFEGCMKYAREDELCVRHGETKTVSLNKRLPEASTAAKPVPLPEASIPSSKPECFYPRCKQVPHSRHLCLKHGGGTCCSFTGCQEHVVSNGKCLAHGGRRCKESSCTREPNMCGKKCARKCIVEDCNLAINLCKSHGGGPRCKFDRCSNAVHSHGFCQRHGVRCKADGCTTGVQTRGFCKAHGPRCKIDGCTTAAQALGICQRHGGGSRCKMDGCSAAVYINGLCCRHGPRCKMDGCNSVSGKEGFCRRHKVDNIINDHLKCETMLDQRSFIHPDCEKN